MAAPLQRLFLDTADIKQISGKSDRTCQRTMQLMRDFFALHKHQQVTVFHACDFFGLTMEQLASIIKISKNI